MTSTTIEVEAETGSTNSFDPLFFCCSVSRLIGLPGTAKLKSYSRDISIPKIKEAER
jgi:hypothetical protein